MLNCKKLLPYLLIFCLLFFHLSSGLIQTVLDLSFRSVVFDWAYLLFYFYAFLYFLKNNFRFFIYDQKLAIYYLLFVLLSFFVAIFVSDNLFVERFLGLRNLIGYMFIGVAAYYVLSQQYISYKFVLFLFFIYLAFSFFGVLQSTIGNYFPSFLMNVKDSAELSFEYDRSMLRANGMVGTTLEFAGFSIIVFVFWLAYFLIVKKSLFSLVASFIALVAVWLTYSRAAFMMLLISIIIINWLKLYSFNKKIFGIVIKMIPWLLFFVVLLLLLITYYSDSLMISRILGDNIDATNSMDMHFEDYVNAIDVIINNPVFGVGYGTQGVSSRLDNSEKIITDGFLFMMPVEAGVPVFVLYILFVLRVIKINLKVIKNVVSDESRHISIVSCTIIILFHVMGIFNSVYLSPLNLSIVWFLVSLTFCYDFYNKRFKI